ncbi:MAG: hypothetical protein K1X83_06880 [Oligoflexia bacterium]|nr:hypothetical protein [Oligoflexia bacterium]
MPPTRQFIQNCAALQGRLRVGELEPGVRVARGFADLGFELFMILSPHKMVSLYTGKSVEIAETEHAQLVPVPSPDELVDLISRNNFDIDGLHFIEQRYWRLTLRDVKSGAQQPFEAATLEEVLLKGLVYSLG